MLDPSLQDPPPNATRPFRHWWTREDIVLLVLLGVLFFLPGLGHIPLFDRDEPRFATAARDMLQSGDYIVPHFNGQLRPDKPPLVYWLMTLGYRAVGQVNELGARLPSAVCSTLTLIVVYFMTGRRFGRLTGLLAAIMLGSCTVFVVESRMATADATMVFFIALAMACAWEAWDFGSIQKSAAGGERMPFAVAMLFWIALAAGVMTKGVPLFFVLVPMVALSLGTGTLPAQLRRWRSHLHVTGTRIILAAIVALAAIVVIARASSISMVESRGSIAVIAALVVGMILLPGLPGVLFHCFAGGNWRWWRQLRPLAGVPLLIILTAWWVILAGVQTNWELINQMVGVHFLARVAGPILKLLHLHIADPARPGGNDPMASYGKPPGFYLAVIWGTFWPWSVLLVPAAYHTVRRALRKTAFAIDPGPYQFLLAFVIPMWIVLELSRGKLFHYHLPLHIALAIACADALVQGWYRLSEVFEAKWLEIVRWVVLGIWLALAAGVLIGARMFLEGDMLWRTILLAGAFAAAGAAGTIAWNRPSWPFVTAIGWACALLFIDTLLLPDLTGLQVARQTGQMMAEMRKDNAATKFAAEGYQEPSMVFYSGGTVEMYPRVGTAGAPTRHVFDDIPFGPGQKPEVPYVIAVDDRALNLLEEKKLQYYRLQRLVGFNTGNFKPVKVTLITNVPPPDTSRPPPVLPAIPPPDSRKFE